MNQQSRIQGYFPGSFFRRSERIIANESGFHYRIRKGKTVGPFESEILAYQNLTDFVETMEKQANLRDSANFSRFNGPI